MSTVSYSRLLQSLNTLHARLAFADAEELHKKIDRLRKRVTSLEDALRVLQSAVSDDPHPLLAEDAMDDKDGSRQKSSPITGPPLSREDEEFLDAFGTCEHPRFHRSA